MRSMSRCFMAMLAGASQADSARRAARPGGRPQRPQGSEEVAIAQALAENSKRMLALSADILQEQTMIAKHAS